MNCTKVLKGSDVQKQIMNFFWTLFLFEDIQFLSYFTIIFHYFFLNIANLKYIIHHVTPIPASKYIQQFTQNTSSPVSSFIFIQKNFIIFLTPTHFYFQNMRYFYTQKRLTRSNKKEKKYFHWSRREKKNKNCILLAL